MWNTHTHTYIYIHTHTHIYIHTQVELGRFSDVDRELRLCKVCHGGTVEDESHFLLKCRALKETRKQHVKPLLKTNPEYKKMSNLEKIAMLISPEHMKEFGKIMAVMFEARQEILYKKKPAS